MTWNDVKLEAYEQLVQWKDSKDFTDRAIEVLFGVKDPQQLPVSQYLSYLSQLDFVGKEIPKSRLITDFTISGRKYEVNINISEFSMGQFTDFENYKKQQPMSLIDTLSTVILPKGHKYNDGYDMQQVKEDIGKLSVVEVNAVFSFFAHWCFRYVDTLTYCLKRQKMNSEVKKQLIPMLETMKEIANLLR